MQNKGLIIALGVLILVIVSGLGIYYVASSRNTATKKAAQSVIQQDAPVPTLSPDDIGLTLALAQDGQSAGHAIDMGITKISDIKGVDYDFSYTYGDNLQQGGFGHLDVKPGDSTLKQEIVLGTCSSGHCRYDANPTHFQVTLRIAKSDGKTYQATKDIDL